MTAIILTFKYYRKWCGDRLTMVEIVDYFGNFDGFHGFVNWRQTFLLILIIFNNI